METTAALYAMGTLLIGVLAYLAKDLFQRINAVEAATSSSLDETKVRLLLSDKLDPLKEDIKEIKDSVGVLMEYNLKKSTSRSMTMKRKVISSAKTQR